MVLMDAFSFSIPEQQHETMDGWMDGQTMCASSPSHPGPFSWTLSQPFPTGKKAELVLAL